MLEFIKEYNEIVYDNFISLTNNIKNRDKNINSQFRITAESILSHINNGNIFKKNNCFAKLTTHKNYGAYLDSIDFMNGLIRYYKFNNKMNRILKNIQETGNETIHNVSKIFDYNDAKEKFRYLYFSIVRVYETETNKNINVSQKNIDNYFDELFENEVVKMHESQVEEINESISKEELLETNSNITNLYKETSNKEKFYSTENLNKIFVFLEKYICYLKTNYNINDTEKLNELGYKKVYSFYKYLEKILAVKEIEDINDLIFNIEDNLFDIKHLIEVKNGIVLFDWYRININNEENNVKELDNYEKIAKAIDEVPLTHNRLYNEGRYYITKKKPFIVNDNKYYELEIQKAVDNESKFDRKTIYTKIDIDTKYSIKISYTTSKYEFLGEQSEIFIVNEWQISIRPCELYNLIYIFTAENYKITKEEDYYKKLNEYLTHNKTNLLEIVLLREKRYEEFLELINDNHKATKLFIESLNKARSIILEEENGSNVLRYLLYTLRNKIIKRQYDEQKNKFDGKKNAYVSNLVLDIGCMQFDKSPLAANLKEHINNYRDVLCSIPCSYRECEALAHTVDKKCIDNQKLFISIEELSEFKNIPELVKEYEMILSDNNRSLKRKLVLIDNYLYKNDYVEKARIIMDILKEFSSIGNNSEYKKLLENSNVLDEIDNDEKRNLLLNLFNNSKISYIYGEAGSGKTEVLANYLSKIFKNYNIAYIANTHNAKENLKRRVLKVYGTIPENIKFYTINQFNKMDFYNETNNPTIILVDEAKVISNDSIYKLLKDIYKYGFDYMIFAGDVSQLDAIKLGNWFDLSKSILNKDIIFEINTIFRSNDEKLKKLWTKVRNYEEDTLDYLIDNGYCSIISDDIFNPKDDSEIILCLNYSGMYGINKINSYFQERNKDSKEYIWGMDKYKVGDKILFNDYATKKYDGVLYNNLKGTIKNIDYMNTKDDEIIAFTIKVDEVISDNDINSTKGIFKVNGSSKATTIMITAQKHVDKDSDDDNDDAVIPFDIAYALSIHKAQGLQYKSVKIVITPESDELITNPIFYTAITRAEEQLNIYWTKEQQDKMLNILINKDKNVDAEYLYKK